MHGSHLVGLRADRASSLRSTGGPHPPPKLTVGESGEKGGEDLCKSVTSFYLKGWNR
jgi:hypothetical protein